MSLLPDPILIPYGVDTWPVETMHVRRLSDGSVQSNASVPCVAISRTIKRPLRLNSEAMETSANFNASLAAPPLKLIMDRLKGFCRPWDRLSLRFLDGYFEHIENLLRVHHDALAAKLAPFKGLYAVEDWAFSAPKPLPRAFLPAARKSENDRWDIGDFVQVEFAFWLGDRMVAALSQPDVLTPMRARERLSRLKQVGVTVVHFNTENLSKSPAALFDRIIGDFDALLEGAGAVPAGPFRPPELGDH